MTVLGREERVCADLSGRVERWVGSRLTVRAPNTAHEGNPPLTSASDGITIPAGLIFPLHPLSDAQHFGPSGSRPPRLPGRPRHPLPPTDSPPTSPTRSAHTRPQPAAAFNAASSSIDNEQGSQPTSPRHAMPLPCRVHRIGIPSATSTPARFLVSTRLLAEIHVAQTTCRLRVPGFHGIESMPGETPRTVLLAACVLPGRASDHQTWRTNIPSSVPEWRQSSEPNPPKSVQIRFPSPKRPQASPSLPTSRPLAAWLWRSPFT